jgi:hypothetical protein
MLGPVFLCGKKEMIMIEIVSLVQSREQRISNSSHNIA